MKKKKWPLVSTFFKARLMTLMSSTGVEHSDLTKCHYGICKTFHYRKLSTFQMWQKQINIITCNQNPVLINIDLDTFYFLLGRLSQ